MQHLFTLNTDLKTPQATRGYLSANPIFQTSNPRTFIRGAQVVQMTAALTADQLDIIRG